MSGPIGVVRMTGMPNLPVAMPAELPVPPVAAPVEPEAADPAAADPVAAANRAAREQLVEALGTMEGLSSRFVGSVRASQKVDKAFEEVDCEFLHMITYSCSKVKSMALLCLTILRMVEVVVKLRNDIARYRSASKLATAKEKAEISQLKIRELIEQIEEALIELDEKIQSMKREMKEESSLNAALQAAAAKHLEAEIRAWRKLVSGFEAREERLHEEARDEMEEIVEKRRENV